MHCCPVSEDMGGLATIGTDNINLIESSVNQKDE